MQPLPSGGALHVAGAAGRPALLFVHGIGGGAWSWAPQRAAFAAGYRVAIWEARGHGAAAAVADAGLADYELDLREALAAVTAEAAGPVVVIAHSLGAQLALALARDLPAEVRGLFLIDPFYGAGAKGYGRFTPREGAVAKVLCRPLLDALARDGFVSRFVVRRLFAAAFTDPERRAAAWAGQRRQVPFEYRRMLDDSFGCPGFDPLDFAVRVDVPIAVLEATKKARGRAPQIVPALRARLGPRFTSETIPGGHYLQLDRPAEVNARIARFLDALGVG